MWAETPAKNTDGGEDDNITMIKVIMMMIIMMNTITMMKNYALIMAMVLERKMKNKRNGEYIHGDHIKEEDDDYNDTSF